MENGQFVKVDAEKTGYGDMKDTAKLLGINYVGKDRQTLANEINKKIDELGGEQVNEQVNEEVEVNEVNEQQEEDSQQENVEDVSEGEEEKNETTSTTTETTTEVTNKKWYEENGYGNKPGDRVIIIGKNIHQSTANPKVILQGRIAEVVGPSKKANTIKARLVDRSTGKLQGCEITLAYGEYADEGTIEVKIPERKSRKKKETTTPVETTNEQVNVESQPKEDEVNLENDNQETENVETENVEQSESEQVNEDVNEKEENEEQQAS